MASRKRGSVQQRGKSISVVIDEGEQPWRRCPTPRCTGSLFTDKAGEMACERCSSPLEPPVMHRRREWHSGFKTKGEANKALVAMLGEADKGIHVEPSTLTVRSYVETQWIRSLETSNLRESTVEMYRRSVKSYILPHLGQLRLRDVTPARVAAWLETLKAAGIGDRTIEVAGITAGKLFKSAFDRELISRNPTDNAAVREARPHPKAQKPTVWSAEETRRFLDSQRDDRLFALWRLAVTTGMRRGELAALRWSDLDLEAGALRVSHTFAVVGYRVVESEPKTEKGWRTIGLDSATVTALKAHRTRQAEEMLAIGRRADRDGYVFTANPQGDAFHPQRLTQLLQSKAKAASLPPIHLHCLRHGHATAALEAGVPMKVVSERLGHSSISITADIYSHVTAAVDQAAAAQVAAAIDGA
ncbi:MAG: tyrosine-type recombinase/integrase [Acidimicrobiales bacterium]|jgi:integrase